MPRQGLQISLVVLGLVPTITGFLGTFGLIGRLLSIAVVGLPPIPFIGFTVLEILGPPLFLYWHRQIAKVMPHDN